MPEVVMARWLLADPGVPGRDGLGDRHTSSWVRAAASAANVAKS